MDLLKTWWPLLVVIILVIVVVRRVRGEPLDLKDAVAAPVILVAIGLKAVVDVAPTRVDLVWLIGLSAVSFGFGVARSATIVIERREGQYVQRYRWTTFALLIASLVVGAGLGMLAQHFGMHEEARPLTFTIGIGLAGEGALTLLRAARRGVRMPWRETEAVRTTDRDRP